MTVFQEITTKNSVKKVVSLSKKLEKKFSKESFNDLGNLQELAYWLFVFSEIELSEKVCNLVADISFKNVDLWAPIEYIKALKAKLLLLQGKTEEAQKYINEIIETGNGSKGFIRRLNGELLPANEINEAISDGDIKTAVAYTFSQIPDLILIEIIGGSDKISMNQVRQMLNNSVNYIICNG